MGRTKTVAAIGVRTTGNLLVTAVIMLSLAFILPSLFGYERYVIMGGSMTGTFNLGSVVFDKTVPVGRLEVGDVITYQPPASSGLDTMVTHRIVKIREDAKTGQRVFRTKGDNNPQRDPWAFRLKSPVQPKVEYSLPYVGWLFIGLANRSIRILVIGCPAGLIALYSLVELVKPLRTRRAPDLATPGQPQPIGA
jgi:signal peptidase